MITKLKIFRFCMFEHLRTYVEAFRDVRRYLRASCTGTSRFRMPVGRLQGRLIATTHVLEKGLAMPEMKPRFGVNMIQSLQRLMNEYFIAGGDKCDVHYQAAVQALADYHTRHYELAVSVDDLFDPTLLEESGGRNERPYEQTAVFESSPDRLFSQCDASFARFAASRHSTRVFDTTRPVDEAIIARAVEVAIRTPSACNRQPWKVYSFLSPKGVTSVIQHHTGSRGFGNQLPGVLVVTSRMDTYSGPGERYQSYVDGGLFAMSLIYALHHQKLGCVPLNWSVCSEQDLALKCAARIPVGECIIMLLGVGHPQSTAHVPTSSRRTVGEVLISKE